MSGTTAVTTIEEGGLIAELLDRPVPGLVLAFSGGRPQCVPLRLDAGPIEIGRVGADNVFVLDDDRVSRRHAQIALRGEGVHVTDLDSRNGTFVEGRRLRSEVFPKLPRVLRIGLSLFLFVPDLRPFRPGAVQVLPDEVIGPTLQRARDAIARAAAGGEPVLLTGPSGSGKELGARAFHTAWTRAEGRTSASGPFVAVNCAAIPTGLAERLLFGARKGAYSGAAADADGYVQAADGGTLFLDEVAELDLQVQPKLLRVLELREVVSLGASHPRKVDVRVCAATLKDLRGEVQSGRFREDLYYRIGRPEVRLPSLIERLEDLPYLACRELEKVDARLTPHALILEAAMLRSWPGNVREFLAEMRRAGREALAEGRTLVKDKDLSPAAGQDIVTAAAAAIPEPRASQPSSQELSRDQIEAALRREHGNVTRAARALGWHRNQLRRWIAKNSVDPKTFGAAVEADDDEISSGRDDSQPG